MPTSTDTELTKLVAGNALCTRTEGKSPKTIDALCRSGTYLEAFFKDNSFSTTAAIVHAKILSGNMPDLRYIITIALSFYPPVTIPMGLVS
jgi:hypothetical protein